MKKYVMVVVVALLICLTFHPAYALASNSATPAPTEPIAASASPVPAWQNAPNIDDVTAGDKMVLEPVDYAKATIAWPGSQNFKFACKPAGKEKLAFKRAMVLSYMEGNFQVKSTTIYSWVAEWEEDQETADVEYIFANDKNLSGEGFLYFYLLDENDVCISNIVMWEVAFQ